MSDNTLPWICVFAILALVIAVSVWLFKPRKPRKVVYGPFCKSNYNPFGCIRSQLVAEMRGKGARCECFEKQRISILSPDTKCLGCEKVISAISYARGGGLCLKCYGDQCHDDFVRQAIARFPDSRELILEVMPPKRTGV